jgi:peptidyl-prolyl cis-trans isomerase C
MKNPSHFRFNATPLTISALQWRATSIDSVEVTDKMNRFLLALISVFLVVFGRCSAFVSTKPQSPFSRSTLNTRHEMSLIDTVQSMYKNWGKKATASHILFRPSQFPEEEAKVKLTEIKAEVGNDPEKFAAAAREWSGCPSSKNGGDLGEFGPGMMVKNFDTVCFSEEVGVVHGPVSTQFGEHLILITKRTGE